MDALSLLTGFLVALVAVCVGYRMGQGRGVLPSLRLVKPPPEPEEPETGRSPIKFFSDPQ